MQTVTTIGRKVGFQVHGIDAEGKVVIRRQMKRRYVLAFFQKLAPCLVGIEACDPLLGFQAAGHDACPPDAH
jgi:transposase